MNNLNAAFFILNLKSLSTTLKHNLIEFMFARMRRQHHPLDLPDLRQFFYENAIDWTSEFEDEILVRSRQMLEWNQNLGIRFISFLDPEFPLYLLRLIEPCLAFSYIGEACWLNENFVAVVGSRDAQRESLNWLNIELAQFLKNNKWGVVSGGALGIDQAAHQVSLRAGRPTIAFLPCGLGHIYPRQFEFIKEQIIAAGGAVISEYPHSMPMHRGMFPHRNRLIAGLGVATVIVQASHKSGSLMTARLSAENSRPVFVVPGHPMNSHFQGSLQLIQEGATPLMGACDLSEFINVEKLSQEATF